MLIQPKIILASASPRRFQILRDAGFEFEVSPAQIDESPLAGETAETYVQRLARDKAESVASKLTMMAPRHGRTIVAADTTVVIEGEMLGKPGSAEDAVAMLRRLSGRWHEVFTGLAVKGTRDGVSATNVAIEKTRVQFAVLSQHEIEEYVATGEPFDKAGAYAIQGRGGKFIPRIEGCYFNVMGLPLARLYAVLREIQTE